MLFFRFPFSGYISTVEESSAKNAVSFFSFDQSEAIYFTGNIKEISRDEFLKQEITTEILTDSLIEFDQENQNDYKEKLKDVIGFIKEKHLSKLVISRVILKGFEGSKVNLSRTFLNLCDVYPNAFVYFFIKDGKCWAGAFSEVLGKFTKKTSDFETMSLAGTISVNETWTTKEIEEQQPVTAFIKNILKNYTAEVQESETYDHISGNIKHLRTDFKAKIKEDDLESIISELHPTPAVCGIPKHLCMNAIKRFEMHPRNFYAGYVKVETEETVQYFVNLRCAEFFKNSALIHVGGGITPQSSPEKEWQETELKSEAILKNLSFS